MNFRTKSGARLKSNPTNWLLILCMTFYATMYSTAQANENSFATNTHSVQQITVDSVNLTGGLFISKLTSATKKDRERAMLYLLGVLDATEGRSWCDYKTLKTITIREYVYEHLKMLPEERLNERASTLIQEALIKSFPCESKQ